MTHDCSPIPFILKNGSYFSKSYNIEKSLQSKGVSLRSSASDLVDTFDLNNRKVVGIDESNPVKPTASRRSSKMGSYPILELEQKSILARELLEKSLSQSMQRQLLCDIRWRMISGYQTSLLGQLFRRFEFIIDSNQNGFDGMFDRLSGLPKAADTGSDALVAGLGFFDTSTRGGMTWEASMRRYMRPGVQWEDWIPPSNRRCPLFIRASMRASSATTIEHHEFRNRTMFQVIYNSTVLLFQPYDHYLSLDLDLHVGPRVLLLDSGGSADGLFLHFCCSTRGRQCSCAWKYFYCCCCCCGWRKCRCTSPGIDRGWGRIDPPRHNALCDFRFQPLRVLFASSGGGGE